MNKSKARLKFEIEKLAPQPGEIVLIQVTPGSLTGDEFRQLQRDTESLAQLLKRLVIIVPPNFDFSTMGETEMRRHGWQHIPDTVQVPIVNNYNYNPVYDKPADTGAVNDPAVLQALAKQSLAGSQE